MTANEHFARFLELLENHPKDEQRMVYQQYRQLMGDQWNLPLTESPWYVDYVSRFALAVPYRVPVGLENEFDWLVLAQLCAASYTINTHFLPDLGNGLGELVVNHGNEGASDLVISEQSAEYLYPLFYYLLEEQLKLFNLGKMDSSLAPQIEQFKTYRLQTWAADQKSSAANISDEIATSTFIWADFLSFLENHPDHQKKEIIKRYKDALGGTIPDSLEEQPWYVDYVGRFSLPGPYKIPESLSDDFDWNLLVRLSAASFSTNAQLKWDELSSKLELILGVENAGIQVTKKVSELLAFQVQNLFNIFAEEQVNLYNYIQEDEKQAGEILHQRRLKLTQWELTIKKLINVLPDNSSATAFQYSDFIAALQADPEKSKTLNAYYQLVGESTLAGIEKQPWYETYLQQFPVADQVHVPFEISHLFDWDLLQRLTAGSFSSQMTIVYHPEKDQNELVINVDNNGISVTKTVSDLFAYQVDRLFHIYTEEQMNLHLLYATDENEKRDIQAVRASRLSDWISRVSYNRIERLKAGIDLYE